MGGRLQLGLAAIMLFAAGIWLGHTGTAVTRLSVLQGAGAGGGSPLPATPVPSVSSPPVARLQRSGLPARDLAFLLEQDQGALFTALFDEEALLRIPRRELVGGLRDRFRRPWPQQVTERERELVRRIGILKAVGRLRPGDRESGPQLIGFYREVLDSGPFLLRRQALRNLAPLLPALPEGERRAVLRRAGSRALAAAAKSEAELLESVVDARR